jgi:hypothetical protein
MTLIIRSGPGGEASISMRIAKKLRESRLDIAFGSIDQAGQQLGERNIRIARAFPRPVQYLEHGRRVGI